MEFLIKTYSNENETILDNTMGSCSSGIACINLNRNFIGIDNTKKYFNISLKRVEEKKERKDFNVVTSSEMDVVLLLTYGAIMKEAIISTKVDAEYKCLFNHKCFCGI